MPYLFPEILFFLKDFYYPTTYMDLHKLTMNLRQISLEISINCKTIDIKKPEQNTQVLVKILFFLKDFLIPTTYMDLHKFTMLSRPISFDISID